jgi:hypothetical protein
MLSVKKIADPQIPKSSKEIDNTIFLWKRSAINPHKGMKIKAGNVNHAIIFAMSTWVIPISKAIKGNTGEIKVTPIIERALTP